jgi:hypothetical protein
MTGHVCNMCGRICGDTCHRPTRSDTGQMRDRIAKLTAERDAQRERLKIAFDEGFGMAASLTPEVYEVMELKDRAWKYSASRKALGETASDEV